MKNLDSCFSKATKVPNMVGKLDHFLILSNKSLCKKPLGNTHLSDSHLHHWNDWSCQHKTQVVCPRCAQPTLLGCS